MDITKMSAK